MLSLQVAPISNPKVVSRHPHDHSAPRGFCNAAATSADKSPQATKTGFLVSWTSVEILETSQGSDYGWHRVWAVWARKCSSTLLHTKINDAFVDVLDRTSNSELSKPS